MDKVTIEAKVRKEGESTPQKIRKEGNIPAVVYGKETKSLPIEIKIKDIQKTVKTVSEGTILITLKLIDREKQEEKTVVIQEIQRDPVTDEIIHADFHQIAENEKTVFKVPVIIKGISEGVKEGGVIEHILREVEVRCMPKDLPPTIDIDSTLLKIGDDLTVKDLTVKEGVEILDNPGAVVLTLLAPHVYEEAAPAATAAAPEAAAAQPELIKKERAVEEGEEGAEKAAEPAGAKKEEKKEGKREAKKEAKK